VGNCANSGRESVVAVWIERGTVFDPQQRNAFSGLDHYACFPFGVGKLIAYQFRLGLMLGLASESICTDRISNTARNKCSHWHLVEVSGAPFRGVLFIECWVSSCNLTKRKVFSLSKDKNVWRNFMLGGPADVATLNVTYIQRSWYYFTNCTEYKNSNK